MFKNQVFEMKAIVNTEDKEFVKMAVDDLKKYVNAIVESVENVQIQEVKLLCYFSLLESFAQDEANYPDRGMQKTFTEFVIEYQNICSYITSVDPVTLFYHVENNLNGAADLSEFVDGGVYCPTDQFVRNKADSLLKKIEEVLGKKKREKLECQHRYVDLLYRMRCRLSHEFSSAAMPTTIIHIEPYYISYNRTYFIDGKEVNDAVWELNIPGEFEKNICLNCIGNYLEKCLRSNRWPTPNDSMGRLCKLSWYSK